MFKIFLGKEKMRFLDSIFLKLLTTPSKIFPPTSQRFFWNDQRYSNSSGLSLPTSLFALELAKMSCFEVFEIQEANK